MAACPAGDTAGEAGPSTGEPGGWAVTPAELQAELQKGGLAVLGVMRGHRDPEMLVVYLHGEAGQWADGSARRKIMKVPGVVTAEGSEPTPTILHVRVKISAQEAEDEDGR